MKDALKVVLTLTALFAVLIMVASVALWFTTDPDVFEHRKSTIKDALLPTLTALVTFLAATGIFKGLLIAVDNAQRLAKNKEPQPITIFS